MARLFYLAPNANYVQKALNGSINSSQTTITLNNTTNLPSVGYIVVDRVNSSGVATPASTEVISYTGISSNDLTGCVRGEDGSTAASHNDAAIVETMPTIGMWNSLTTITSAAVDNNGYLKAINSPVSIARAHLTNIIGSAVTIATSINASGASVVGIGAGGLNAIFQVPGSLASAANIGGMLLVPTALDGKFISAGLQTPASIASVGIFILKNGAVYGTVHIGASATFASSASIGTSALAAGDFLTMDIRSNASLAGELSVLLRAT